MAEAGCVRSAHDSLPRCDVHVAAWRGDFCRDAYDHARAVLTSLSARVAQERAAALREAEAVLDLPGCGATGYYASEEVSGYNEAERHACDWLRARADEIEPEVRP